MSPQKVSGLVSFFGSVDLSSIHFSWLSECEKVTDLKKMVESHLNYCRTGRERFEPYYNRLLKLKKLIQDE